MPRLQTALFEQPHPDFVRELAEDLDAVWAADRRPLGTAVWLTRPGLLRRVALLLAERLDGTITRVLGVGDGGDVLATAVSLASGIPFASTDQSGQLSGTVHRGDVVAIVAVSDAQHPIVGTWLTESGAALRLTLTVLGEDGLFRDDAGTIRGNGANHA